MMYPYEITALILRALAPLRPLLWGAAGWLALVLIVAALG